jgi:hypothetical protein
MAPRQIKGLELGCIATIQGENLVLALGSTQHPEVHAIKACAVENLERNYKNRTIYILSDSQAAIKALVKYLITSKLVWDCHQSLVQLIKHNRVQLIWVSGHDGIVGNETADQLVRTGYEHPFIVPELAFGISIGVAKNAVRDWMNRNHKKKKQTN